MPHKLEVDEIIKYTACLKECSLYRVDIAGRTRNMDLTRLLVVFLCAFASEVNGAHLATAISHRHPTGNASARSALEETTTKVAPKTISFSLNQYAQRLYDRINSHLNEVDQGVQFAFIMIVRSYELRFDFPQAMKDRMTGSDVSLPPLNKGGTYPADGNSNLVIAGLDRSKPMQGGGRDTPYHSEQQVIAKMPAMDNYYDHHYFENLENLICPWIIILGSKFDTCYNEDPKFGNV